MRVCLICIEFFGDAIYGGFGRATRFIGQALAGRGVDVSVVVPRRSDALPDEYTLDGMKVSQYEPHRPWRGIGILRRCRADIYHSQDASTTTLLAQIARPGAVHVVTFRDPMNHLDWRIETDYSGAPRLDWASYRYFIDNPLVTLALRRADSLHCAAEFLQTKSREIFGLPVQPTFLPSPVAIPRAVSKAPRPTVCYVGRFDGRKRVELFFELARQFPDVDFIAVGKAHDPERDRALRRTCDRIDNLKMPGVLDQFEDPAAWGEVLGRSWVLVNTSVREGLPTTFIEAAAHRCAILSFTDPDRFASRFGAVAREGRLDEELSHLLADGRWKRLGDRGHQYVREVFEVDRAIDAHLALYERLLERRKHEAERGS